MKYQKYIVLLALALGIGLVIWAGYNPEDPGSSRQTKDQVNRLRDHIDSLEQQNQKLEWQYQALQQTADSLKLSLLKHNSDYNQLKQRKHEAIIRLTQLNSDSLYQFFSNFNTKDPVGER